MDQIRVNIQIEKALLYHFTFRSRKTTDFAEDYRWIEKGKTLSSDLTVFSPCIHQVLPSKPELEMVRKSYQKAYEKGVRWTFLHDQDYPVCLRDIEDPAFCLSYLGKA